MGDAHVPWADRVRKALEGMRGRKFLGAVDGGGCTELVFEPSGASANLVTLYANGDVAVGYVDEELIRAGYVDD